MDLPWEVRRLIILQALRDRRSEPTFNRKLIESRARLRNCFDNTFPELTNLYIARHKNLCLHGNALRETNRQLRHETNVLAEEETKSGNIETLFELDVMIVKDIGIFPTWLSFPYQPKHLKTLTINLRIVRLGMTTVPDEWIDVARYEERRPSNPTYWNLMMTIVLYAFGWLSIKPDPKQPSNSSNSQPVIENSAIPAKQRGTSNKINHNQPPTSNIKKVKSRKQPDLARHQSHVLDAHLLSSASYVTDDLLINFKGLEYDVKNNAIPPGVSDNCKRSRFFKDGFVQFGREVFVDYDHGWKDSDQIEEEQGFLLRGTFTSYQLQDSLIEILCGANSSDSEYALYLRMLARSARQLRILSCEGYERQLLERHASYWTDMNYSLAHQSIQARYTEANIEWAITEQLQYGSSQTVDNLHTVQIRRSHGWVSDDD